MNRLTLTTAVACCTVVQALLACGPACFDDTTCADGQACLDGRCLEVTPCDNPPRTRLPCTADGGCDFPVDTWGTPTNPHPFDLVFVPEAFTRDDMETFRQRAHRLAGELLTDPDSIIGRRPGLFRFHAVLAPSASAEVRNAELSDTLLGGCLHVDHEMRGPLFLHANLSAARALAEGAVPGAAGTVVLFNTTYGRANAVHGWHAVRRPPPRYPEQRRHGPAPVRGARAPSIRRSPTLCLRQTPRPAPGEGPASNPQQRPA